MDPAANQRIAPNRVALILALLLGVWLVFQFYPRKKPAPPLPSVGAESKLRAFGLPDNVDLEGLPEFFAIVADKAEWKDGRTRFAYWHPVMKTYSYYFEASRKSTGFRFREIPEPHEPDHYWDEEMAEDSRIRFYYSVPAPVQLGDSTSIISDPAGRDIRVNVNMDSVTPSIPPLENKIIPADPATKP